MNNKISLEGCAVISLGEYEQLKRDAASLNVHDIKDLLAEMRISDTGTGSYNDILIHRMPDGPKMFRYYIEVTDL